MEQNSLLCKLARMIDISAVRTDVTEAEILEISAFAKKYHFICAFAMPCFTKMLIEELKPQTTTMVGGVVGFPSGADTTRIKIATAAELMEMGCDELDMVTNVGALKSGHYEQFRDDIKAIVDIADGLPVKSILETAYLTNDEIARGSLLAVEAGVTFVKTGTGWAQKPTTVATIRLIKSTIGNSAKIKAAGGVRNIETLLTMAEAGCDRFGVSLNSLKQIINECEM